jgi:hypothetical protein
MSSLVGASPEAPDPTVTSLTLSEWRLSGLFLAHFSPEILVGLRANCWAKFSFDRNNTAL